MSTEPEGWAAPKTDWIPDDTVGHSDLNRWEGNSGAIETGERTLDPAQAPSSSKGSLRQILDWLANRIKAITGATNWYDAPATTLVVAKDHIDAAAPHGGHAIYDRTCRYVRSSDTVQYQAPKETSTDKTSYQLKKALTLAVCGSVRVKGEFKISNAAEQAKVKLSLMNQGGGGIEISTSSTAYTPFSYDLLPTHGFERVDVHLAVSNASAIAYLRNVAWCFDDASPESVLDI